MPCIEYLIYPCLEFRITELTFFSCIIISTGCSELNHAVSEMMMTTATVTTTASSPALICSNYAFLSSKPLPAKSSFHLSQLRRPRFLNNASISRNCFFEKTLVPKQKDLKSRSISCDFSRRKSTVLPTSSAEEGDDNIRRVLQVALWVAEGVYVVWLFLLPFAPVRTCLTSEPSCASCIIVLETWLY